MLRNNLKKTKIALYLVASLFTMTAFTVYQNNTIIENPIVTPDPGKDYDEGYNDGYCEAWRDYRGNKYEQCRYPTYIDNATYLDGCENYYKCGFKAGLKHGQRDFN